MKSLSVLFSDADDRARAEAGGPPPYFADLNLDQLLDAITIGKENQYLKPFFLLPLGTKDAIEYRQGIMNDVDGKPLLGKLKTFNENFGKVRRSLDRWEKQLNMYERRRWLVDAAKFYCSAVRDLQESVHTEYLQSSGLQAFFSYLDDYVKAQCFRSLEEDTARLVSQLKSVRYTLLFQGNRVTVSKYAQEPDFGAEIEETFEKFKRGAAKDYRSETATWPEMNHVEEAILEKVVLLFPEEFAALDHFCTKHAGFVDETIALFEREIRFYTVYLEFVSSLRSMNLSFCMPQVSEDWTGILCRNAFDMALASKFKAEGKDVVPNDFSLDGNERVLVVTGPNQGGKTTFARLFGQIHHLAALGCPVPASSARIVLFDTIYTHFVKEENTQDLRGKLQDDLLRIHAILSQATNRSIVLINEIFTSTTSSDALLLSRRVLEMIRESNLVCVWVTFIDELASFGEDTVSMVGTVNPENPAERTYKILRNRPNGLAYAKAITEKYRLTYEKLRERIPS